MASISGIFPTTGTPTTSQTNQTSSSSSSGASALSSSSSLGNEQTFLQLLVAQLQNQDPTQPQDGMQFVTQLAQFSNLEQNIAMRSDMDTISTKYAGTDSSTTSSTSGSTTGTTGTTGTQQVQ